MTKNLNYYSLMIILALFLSGCISCIWLQPVPVKEDDGFYRNQHVLSVPSEQLQTNMPESLGLTLYHLSSCIHHYNWAETISPMVSKMLQTLYLTRSDLLLVNNINNRTNGLLNVNEATKTLYKILLNNSNFTLVPMRKVYVVKLLLGISPLDSLVSRSKAIGIARKVEALFVLYSSAIGNVRSPSLLMLLMLVKTGEIIWSGESIVALRNNDNVK